MLKGWTLTDLHCETCRVTPLMREPSAAAAREGREPVQFCALCDGGPSGRISQAAATGAGAAPVASTSSSAQPSSAEASTDRPCQPLRSDDSGDDAASQISALLLQGYSLLNENCPQATCARVPLVGFPRKKDGAKDGRRLCVSCGGRWVSERDTAGMKLVPASSASSSSSALQPGPSEREQTKSRADDFAAEAEKSRARLSGGNPESPRSRTIRELYEAGSMMNTRKEEKVGQPVSTKPLDLETDDVEDLETVTGPSQNQSHPRGESVSDCSIWATAMSRGLTLASSRHHQP